MRYGDGGAPGKRNQRICKNPILPRDRNLRTGGITIDGEWKAVEGSRYFNHPCLYKENGFKERKDAEELIAFLSSAEPRNGTIASIEKKKETKNPPLLYNLAELQNDCSKMFKISPDRTLKAVQELYEKKTVTYPRTDARVLSTAVAKEIHKNIGGLQNFGPAAEYAREVLASGSYKTIAKTRYVNDKQITDHYAIVPTGQGLGALRSLSELNSKDIPGDCQKILKYFLSSGNLPEVYGGHCHTERAFFAGFKVLREQGYLKVAECRVRAGKKNTGAPDAGSDGNVLLPRSRERPGM